MNYDNIRRIHTKGIGNIFNKITEANLSNMGREHCPPRTKRLTGHQAEPEKSTAKTPNK